MQTLVEKKVYYKSKLDIVRDAKIEDVFELARTMREEDKREIWKSHHKTPEQALMEGYLESEICFTIEHNEKPIAMFGIVPQTLIGGATVWLLGSIEIEKIQRAFIRHSKRFLDMFLEYYPYLENWVSVENTKSIGWLKYLGATIEEAQPYGIERALFRHFYFLREL
jgi:hypothetical protein